MPTAADDALALSAALHSCQLSAAQAATDQPRLLAALASAGVTKLGHRQGSRKLQPAA